jgi:opacity protein-like surface antigen
MRRRLLFVVAVCVGMAGGAFADSVPPIDVQTRARGAERVVVASIESVYATYDRNEFGDDLIVSRAWVRVREVMKGAGVGIGQGLEMDVEGGTVGEVTLRVSDMPGIAAGDEAILFLTRDRRGRVVPYLRGLGILKVDGAGRVAGSNVTVDDLRPLLRGRP